jgi:tRNA dimethylallyltransferase
MKKIIQVLGPTGVGKSSVAVKLAAGIGAEIISADSMQVYKDFDIGTDKITEKDAGGIPHHLIDILSDSSQFNASMFLEQSYRIAREIIERRKVPIVCGGTALYLKTMIKGIFPEAKLKRVTRDTLNRIVDRVGIQAFWDKLNSVDPDYAATVGKNDRVRIVRAMEIYYNNGKPPTEIFRSTRTPFEGYRFIRIGLNMKREELYRRIEKRVDLMMEHGLLEEFRRLKEKYPLTAPPFKSLGYKEIMQYFQQEDMSLDEAVALIKQHSRNFAKRQLSWFRQETDIQWFHPENYARIEGYVSGQLQDK